MQSVDEFFSEFQPYVLPVFKNGVRLPEINIPKSKKEELNLALESSNLEYLKSRAIKQCRDKINKGVIKQSEKECLDRLDMEFGVFEKTGTTDYILLLMDIFLWCDDNDVPRGPGRGSAAGSLTLYVLDLTWVNPLDHDLNFTRFLNEARAKTHMVDGILHVDGKSFADFDGDISFRKRPDVLRRIERDYPGKSCKILTLQYLTGRTALKDTVKSVLEYSESEAMEVTSHIEDVYGKVDSLDKTYKKSKDFVEWADKNKDTYKIARRIEGLLRGSGQHASGILISYYNLAEIMPMELAATGELVCGFDMDVALTISLKADLLGLRTLDVLDICCKHAGIKYRDIDINSPEIYKYLSEKDVFYGLFQIKDGLTRDVVCRVKPKNIDQIAACLSISRPGALEYIDDYVKYVSTGERKRVYGPIDDLLEPTGGIFLYQEQINDVCQKVYKMNALDADDVRRAIGKKDEKAMAKWEPELYSKSESNSIPKDVTKYFWDTCNASANYLFNKNHCYSYGYVTVWTVFCKAVYSREFFLACLQMAKDETEPTSCISKIQSELGEFNIPLLNPDITISQDDYILESNGIRMGLSGIKGVSEKGLEKLHHFNKRNSNKFEIMDSFQSAGLSIAVITPLILAGCINNSSSRSKLLLEFELYKLLTLKERPLVHQLGEKFNYDLHKIVMAMTSEIKDEKGKPLIKESRFATIKKNIGPYSEKYRMNVQNEELSSWIFEKEYLGFAYSTSLIKIYSKTIKGLVPIDTVLPLPERSRFVSVAVIDEVEKRTSRKKEPYLFLKIHDDTGNMKAFIWGAQAMEAIRNKNEGNNPMPGDIIVIHGSKKHEDGCYINDCVIQDNEVVLKKSQLKKT